MQNFGAKAGAFSLEPYLPMQSDRQDGAQTRSKEVSVRICHFERRQLQTAKNNSLTKI